ncbi:MAG: nucleoside-diphosphate sugar epimerase/dehydratase [Bacteroidales bacterium]|nr:nucleoside-diphosphate sugar epimerase/dehydratase [Bacteroidales bacterium]
MNKKFKLFLVSVYNSYSHLFTPRWIVLVFDLSVIFFTFFIAFTIRANFEFKEYPIEPEIPQAFFVTFTYFIAFLLFKSYSGIIRHTGLNDAYRIFQATASAFLFLLGYGIFVRLMKIDQPWTYSFAVILIHFLLSYFLLMGFRIVVKTVISKLIRSRSDQRQNVVIYGAGSAGIITRNALASDPNTLFDIIAFADDNTNKASKMIEGVPVLLPEQVLNEKFVSKNDIGLLIIAIQKLSIAKRAEVVEKAIELGLEVKIVPPIENWIRGQLSSTQLRVIRIEELLEREPIKLDNEHVATELRDKVVMVTGAAGSIGSEIVRQVLQYNPEKIILVDQAESALYDLMFEIKSSNKLSPFANRAIVQIANINDRFRMGQIFEEFKPHLVYHAAAYKHVPLMEENPYEAVLVNVFGTRTVADLAVEFKVQKFVMISTDKAVNPTNVMGATKRIAEIYIQSLSNGATQFITTRFGNVLGSNGSVIPLFRKQIEKGGPVTLTHKDIIRYFMTIPEACNLVLEAGSMGKGEEIFIFDMGKPIKIFDLARKMIRLSGLEPEKDIKIIETGLRPGEKLFEELLSGDENTLQTYHPKIMRSKVREYDANDVKTLIAKLGEVLLEGNMFSIVKKMKEIVPEFISNNSVFEDLDKPRLE